ncbi:TetR/AcrR family transcriptional regulator [Streptomyces sp. NPDC058614]|uniref:TetR/AcrR family transcriptional regulator n=1 Tax=Streptomyces sp. NPDC058614 TaxID=3346557 RepID=UPI0036668C66
MTTDHQRSPGKGPAKGSRTRLSSDERRDKIVEAAREVFVKYGLAGARTRDIAEAAGVNEALLYRHFRSKEELFEVAVVGPLEDATAWLVQVLPGPEDDLSEETVHQRMRQHMLNTIRAMDEVAPLLGVMLFSDEVTASTFYKERVEPHLAELKRILELNLPHWRHRDFDPELVIQAAFGAAWFRAINARFTGRPLDFEVEADQLTALVLDGLQLREQ